MLTQFCKAYFLTAPYLDSYQDNVTKKQALGADNALRNDVLRVVTAHIVKHHVDDDWTFEHMLRLGALGSATYLYLIKIANMEGPKAEEARGRIKIMTPIFTRIPNGNQDFETIKNNMLSIIPKLREIDAKKSIHLFDSPNEAIAESASLVFSAIYDIPAPENMTRAEEKAFWQAKMGGQPQVRTP